MAIVDPGMIGEPSSTTARHQPGPALSSGFWGWGGFVNFYGAGVTGVQNVANVFRVTGLGQERSEYPVGAPDEGEERYILGRSMANAVTIEAWMSKYSTDTSHDLLMEASDSGASRNFVIGLGDNQRLFAFKATVRGYAIDASLDTAVSMQITLRPSGKLTRPAPL